MSTIFLAARGNWLDGASSRAGGKVGLRSCVRRRGAAVFLHRRGVRVQLFCVAMSRRIPRRLGLGVLGGGIRCLLPKHLVFGVSFGLASLMVGQSRGVCGRRRRVYLPLLLVAPGRHVVRRFRVRVFRGSRGLHRQLTKAPETESLAAAERARALARLQAACLQLLTDAPGNSPPHPLSCPVRLRRLRS
jgi:hypothetical protein